MDKTYTTSEKELAYALKKKKCRPSIDASQIRNSGERSKSNDMSNLGGKRRDIFVCRLRPPKK